jgi:Transglutaminase-like superfamily
MSRKLTWAKLKLVIKAYGLLWLFRLVLWVLPYERVKSILEKQSFQTSPNYKFREIIRVVNRAGLLVLGATCLSRALTAKALLAQSGYQTELCMGIARQVNGKVKAHAWLEKDGEVVMNNLRDLFDFVKISSQL